MPNIQLIKSITEQARTVTPMSAPQRRRLTEFIAAERKVSLANFFGDHAGA